MSATLDELRRVIRRIEQRRPPRPAAEPVERVLGGELVDTGEGPLVVVRHEMGLAQRHGATPLAAAFEAGPPTLTLLARDDGPVPDVRRLLFLDTETTGLAGGTGTYAFLVGAARLEGDRLVVRQHLMRDFDDEPALLAALAPLLAEASAVVTFNGSGFDLPLLETRFVLGRRRWPAALPGLDLLRPSRRVWARWLEDCRLATLERHVLGHARETDVPGALIPSLYFDFLRSRRAGPLAGVLAHNREDVLALVALLGWFHHAVGRTGEVPLDGPTLAGLGRLFEPRDVPRALDCYREALAAGLAREGAGWVRLRLARWEKRQARWEAARALWEAAAGDERFDPRPWEELAKFHEHRARDLVAARAVVCRALDGAARANSAPRIVESFAHRLLRLDRRLARSPRPSADGGVGGPSRPPTSNERRW